MIKEHTITASALCRECAKEFGILDHGIEGLMRRIQGHVYDFPGHTVIGVEEKRFIATGVPCIVR